jgi:Fe(3+) dicitrate transport protein
MEIRIGFYIMINFIKVKRRVLFYCFLFLSFSRLSAQHATIKGKITYEDSPVSFASIIAVNTNSGCTSDSLGNYIFFIPSGNYTLTISSIGFLSKNISVQLLPNQLMELDIVLSPDAKAVNEVAVYGNRNASEIERMKDVEGTAIYAGKKNEVISMDKISANTATNNTRQIFAKVPGINIIENDAAGIQMSIATRGLNPNRITEFNSRQNGYDISASPIGYPESYYTPPTDALSKIEVVRGAASLQYGSQFGGLLNFVMRDGPRNKKIEVVSKQTIGSYGFYNSYNSIGGTYKRIRYYSYFSHKQGIGWRQNTGFHINNAYISIKDSLTKRLTLGVEFSTMLYTMQQPGGLTDAQFYANPRASYRNRNWFSAGWNLPVVTLDYTLGKNTKMNMRNFALIAYRSTVGNLNSINVVQPDTGYRTIMYDNYTNIGSETRLMHQYTLFNKIKSTGLIGFRYFRGNTHRRQGNGSAGSNADFHFNKPDNELEGMNFNLPANNVAIFIENIFRITNRLSVTPGVRFEYIKTSSNGYYMLDSVRFNNKLSNPRHFTLMGLGIGYKVSKNTNIYANWSQNYSPISYSDIYVLTPDLKVDPNLKDVTGYNADIGWRGNIKNILTFDIGGFMLYYNNRIGVILQADNQANIYQYETNIANSRNQGIESFVELDIFKLIGKDRTLGNLSVYSTVAYTDARYLKSPYFSIIDKKVEYAPSWITKFGCTYKLKKFSSTLQYSSSSLQYTDATNAVISADGVTGIIPSYFLMDFSANYSYKFLIFGCSINNLTNNMYFTRRTNGMPGPGIIPGNARSFYFTLGFKL